MRTTIISTSKLRIYKRLIFILDGCILVCILVFLFYGHANQGKLHRYLVPILIYLQSSYVLSHVSEIEERLL
jgi:hypothetical protein